MPLDAVLTDGLLHDASALAADAVLEDVLAAHLRAVAGPHGDAVGALAVPASSVEALRPLADPEGTLVVSLVADEGLLALQEARHLMQDDTWLTLDSLRIALPGGFSPESSTAALLDELAFTAPTYVEVPRTGYEPALDVLAEDGVERAAYRCGTDESGDLVTDGELAAFVHGCVDRGIAFVVTSGLDHPVRGPGAHGGLNVVAAVAAAKDGASTDDLAGLIATTELEPLLAAIARTSSRTIRDTYRGHAVSDPAASLAELVALDVIAPDAD